jgi:hypothetical protein
MLRSLLGRIYGGEVCEPVAGVRAPCLMKGPGEG